MHNIYLSDKGMLEHACRVHRMYCFSNLELISFYFSVNVVAQVIRKAFY